jgi:hypothetical protein
VRNFTSNQLTELLFAIFLFLSPIVHAKNSEPLGPGFATSIESLYNYLKGPTSLIDKSEKIRTSNEKYLKELEELRIKATKNPNYRAEYSKAFDLYDRLIPLTTLVFDKKKNTFSQKECLESLGLIANSNGPAPDENAEAAPLKKEELELKDLVTDLCK